MVVNVINIQNFSLGSSASQLLLWCLFTAALIVVIRPYLPGRSVRKPSTGRRLLDPPSADERSSGVTLTATGGSRSSCDRGCDVADDLLHHARSHQRGTCNR